MTDNKINVAIAGYGIVGKIREREIIKSRKYKLVGISDIKFKNIVKKKGITYTNNFRKLFELKIDAIFICLPNNDSPKVVIESLKKNIHVFCEKPPGKNINDIKKIISIENKNKKILLKFGFNHRYHNSYLETKKIIQNKKFGEIINLRAVYGKSSIQNWRREKSIAGGGILLDQGIHLLDLILDLVGEPKEVKSFVDNSYWNYNVEDNAYILMKFKKNIYAFMHSSATEWRHKFQLEITLEKAIISLEGILSNSRSYGDEKFYLYKKNLKNLKLIKPSIYKKFTKDNSWLREINEFYFAISNKSKIDIGNSQEAYKLMALIEKIYKSDLSWKKFL